MFKKKPTVKPLAPIRSSDRRKLADQIIQDYGLTVAVPENATDEEKAAATAQHTQLRNSLLPDNVQTARFTTTQGPELRPVSGSLYVGSHGGGSDARVLWFSLEGHLYPSVYSLWQNPKLVPLLHTPEPVVDKLKGGANLMTPGLAGPPFPARATTGATVAVASLGSPSVPVVVGTCVIDIAALKSARGVKGHAVETLHWFGDEIWSFSTSGKPGKQPPEEIPEWVSGETDTAGLAGLSLHDDEDGGVPLEDSNGVPKETSAAAEATSDIPVKLEFERVEPKALSTKEIDEAFRKAFLYGIHEQITSSPGQSSHGLNFPLTQSVVMSTLIQPFLPIFTPEDSKQLQIKNSSFKGLKKFLKTLDKERLIKSKEKPNETLIMDIDFKDPAIVNFKPYRLPKKETTTGTANSGSATTTTAQSDIDPSIGQQLSLQTVYKVPERLMTFFESPQSIQLLSSADLKSAVSDYIDRNSLVSTTNKRLVKLDPFLSNTLFSGATSLDSQVRAQGSVARDALADRALSACTVHWILIRKSPGGETSAMKPRSGQLPKVKITLETRSGNKTATKVSGLERFFVGPGLLADELRRVCAGSTSVEPLVGASPKDNLQEVMIQGPQKDAVIKALEKRGVKASWVEVLDKTKKKK
ncbi:hypothetical protein ANO11243_016910 [Dothideomycetidae sp. 11243]|nr:hypothetical protein ANO11243_016910 [fungal sp. No.11243]